MSNLYILSNDNVMVGVYSSLELAKKEMLGYYQNGEANEWVDLIADFRKDNPHLMGEWQTTIKTGDLVWHIHECKLNENLWEEGDNGKNAMTINVLF